MTLELLKQAKRKTIGSKQTMRGVCSGRVANVFLASDAEDHVIKPLQQLCDEKAIPYLMVESMLSLGKACGIRIGAAAAGIMKETDLN